MREERDEQSCREGSLWPSTHESMSWRNCYGTKFVSVLMKRIFGYIWICLACVRFELECPSGISTKVHSVQGGCRPFSPKSTEALTGIHVHVARQTDQHVELGSYVTFQNQF